MSAPFSSALSTAFTFSFIACLIAAAASWLRGGKYHYVEPSSEPGEPAGQAAGVTDAATAAVPAPAPGAGAGPASGADGRQTARTSGRRRVRAARR